MGMTTVIKFVLVIMRYGGLTGHISAFVQNTDDTWYYFYWGPDDVFLKPVDNPSVMSSVRRIINRWINEQGMNNIPLSGNYNSFVYIPGDFTASLIILKSCMKFFTDIWLPGVDGLMYRYVEHL